MAEPTLTKVKTGSVGKEGEPIFDVFAGQEHIKDPTDIRLKGVDIASLPEGVAPTGFTSQFLPVTLDVADKIPAEVLEDKTTKIDIQAELQKNITQQEKAREELIKLAKPTEEETKLTTDIEALNEMLRQGIQQVEERPLGGAVLRSGIASEINNITQGNTRESLVILRNIDTKTRLLTVEQRKRQQEIEVEKLKLDRDIASEDSLFKIDKLNRDMRKDAEDKEDRLTSRQKTYLDNITSSFVGLTYDELTPEQQRTVAQQANQIDPSGVLLAGIRNRMQVEKNTLDLDIAGKKSLIAERGKKGGTLTITEARDLGLPLSLVGKSEADVMVEIGSDNPPVWFRVMAEQQVQASLTDSELRRLWQEFQTKFNDTTSSETSSKTKLDQLLEQL